MSIGDAEIKTQERVIRFFKDPEILGYQYIGNLSDYQNKNIKEDRLRQYLRLKGYADKLIDAAVMQLQQEAGNLSRGVYDANKTVYSRLKYGIPVSESPEKPPVTVELIDEANPLNNDFAIAEEVTVVEQQEKRPDLVIYLNGIAVAVIELKRSSISVSEGIRQNLTNQKDSFIRGFFTTMQFCMAGNESEGLRYGTLLTGEKFYMEWKDDGFKEHEEERDPVDVRISKTCEVIDNKLLKQIYAMFDKERFIDLIMNFVVFDKGIKKVCRYNQYFGIKRTQQRLNNLRTELHNPNRDQDKPLGGILWHTQGSGKTLTMVWLAKWILTHWAELNARVLIVTDRDELDEQIEKTFTGVDENIARTKSGKDLLNRLNVYDDSLICSLVHKFGRRGGEATENDYDKYIEELKASLPADFEAKGNLVVFVDECHRTQSGKLHTAMKTIMPNAVFIGFTGTPLLKKDKKISIEVFGTYIHAYKYNEGVADGVVLDLRYEYRDVPQNLSSQDRVDQWFDVKTRGLSSRAKAKLKEKWGTIQKDKVSIEHILPQTPTKYYWRNMYRQFKDSEIKILSGALGNLLPLSQSVNSALQNDSFEDKKHSKTTGRRGYENGSHSEIEVSKLQDWTAFEIYSRTEKLLVFMQERWNLQFDEEQLEKLIGISFVKDGREIPEELEEVSVNVPESEESAEGSGDDQKLQFWTAFVNYANEHGRSSDIAKQKAAGRTYYDVHIGANGYHLFFSIPYGKRIKMGIYTYNVDTYNRLKELKDQIETEFGENLNWEYSKLTGTTRSIVIEEKADVFNPAEQPKIFDWIIDHFDRITTALSMTGEHLSISGDSSETRFEIRKRYWTYALTQIHEAHGNPGSFSNVNPSTDNWINGFFGIGGFYLCCVANFDSARSEVVFARAERSEKRK